MGKENNLDELRDSLIGILSQGKSKKEIEKFLFLHENGEIGTFFDKSIVNINMVLSEDGTKIINIYSNLIFDIAIEQKLLSYLLQLNSQSLTGAFNIITNEEGTRGIVSFSFAYMINEVDRDIFLKSFFTVGQIANYYAKEIKSKFGGLTIKEYIESEGKNIGEEAAKKPNKGKSERSEIKEIWE
ncbi:hypothetical protein J7J58_02295 [candidate division WOR-3 bacterium]|nr:hypothetical protein [candidate division WOR-3 bacterium]